METCNIHPTRHNHLKFKICIIGATDTKDLPPEIHEIAKDLGKQIALLGGVLLTNATTGFGFWAAMGAKEAGGITIGFSPAKNEKEHVGVYKLPIDFLDTIIYTGFGIPGRDLLLTRASDAMIYGPGKMGAFFDFALAYEDQKPIGVLQGEKWESDDLMKTLLEKVGDGTSGIEFDTDPKRLLEKVIEVVKRRKVNDTNCNDPFVK